MKETTNSERQMTTTVNVDGRPAVRALLDRVGTLKKEVRAAEVQLTRAKAELAQRREAWANQEALAELEASAAGAERERQAVEEARARVEALEDAIERKSAAVEASEGLLWGERLDAAHEIVAEVKPVVEEKTQRIGELLAEAKRLHGELAPLLTAVHNHRTWYMVKDNPAAREIYNILGRVRSRVGFRGLRPNGAVGRTLRELRKEGYDV